MAKRRVLILEVFTDKLCLSLSPGFVACRRPKRIRTAFTPTQLLHLENAFDKNHYIVGTERKQLASYLNLSETQIKVWFQNRRTKYKRQQAEEKATSQQQSGSSVSDSECHASNAQPQQHQSRAQDDNDTNSNRPL